jgi:tetratricopeptide (TPR) repeat protein
MEERRNRYMLALIATGIAVLVGGFATIFSVFVKGKITEPEDMLRIASAELAAGRLKIVEQLALQADVNLELDAELYWSKQYLLGAARVQQALEKTDVAEKKLALLAALPLLQQAAQEGVLKDSRGRLGHRLLGSAAYQLGQFEVADQELTKALSLDPTVASEVLPEIIRSRLIEPKTPAVKAIEASELYLRVPRQSPVQERDAYLFSAQAWMKAENWSKATEAIDRAKKAEPESEHARLQQAALSLAEIEALALDNPTVLSTAAVIGTLEEALDAATEVARTGSPELLNQANLLGAKILRRLGRKDAALSVFMAVRMSRSPAFVAAAGIEEIELLAELADYRELQISTRVVIQEVGSPLLYDSSLLRVEDFRDRLSAVSEKLLQKDAFEPAIEYTKLLPPIVPEAEALTLEGRAWKAWADGSKKMLAELSSARLKEEQATFRQRSRAAGYSWERAAKLRFTESDYPARLWLAIQAFQEGGAYEESLLLLDEYLRYTPREGQPRGLLFKGKSLLAVGQVEQSLPPLTDCIEQFPRDPIRHEARLLAGLANAELGNLAVARSFLEANVDDDQLEPENPISRDSLIALGKLLYRQGLETHLALTPLVSTQREPSPEQRRALQQILDDAINRLETADERYSSTYRKARQMRYLAGLAHRMAAHWPLQESQLPDVSDSARRDFAQKHRKHLETALLATSSLRKELSEIQEREPLTDVEEFMLHNCYLSEGDTLYDLGRYEDALNIYASAALRYNGEPISLEATVRQARCYLAMNRPDDASRVYRQAEKNLARIPDTQNEQFVRTTRHDREGWKSMLKWLTES